MNIKQLCHKERQKHREERRKEWYDKFNDGADMATDAYNTAMDMIGNHGMDSFDWFKPNTAGEHFEFPIWDGNYHDNHHDDHSDHDWDSNHNDWFDHGTDYMADMGWPDLNNFDGTDFEWGDYGKETPSWDQSWGPTPTDVPSHWDHSWGGHHDSRGIDGELPADLVDHTSWLSSLLPDTTDKPMDNSWFPDLMTHTSTHFDFDMGSKMEDFNKPQKGSKGKSPKKPKGPQKGTDVGPKKLNIVFFFEICRNFLFTI